MESAIWGLIGSIIGAAITGIFSYDIAKANNEHNLKMQRQANRADFDLKMNERQIELLYELQDLMVSCLNLANEIHYTRMQAYENRIGETEIAELKEIAKKSSFANSLLDGQVHTNSNSYFAAQVDLRPFRKSQDKLVMVCQRVKENELREELSKYIKCLDRVVSSRASSEELENVEIVNLIAEIMDECNKDFKKLNDDVGELLRSFYSTDTYDLP